MNRFFNMIPGEDACCILLYGDIGEYSDVTAAAIVRELMEAEASGKRIDVRINSNGGDVYTGIAIFNALRGSKAGYPYLCGRHRRQHGQRDRPVRKARRDEQVRETDAAQRFWRLLR